MLRRMLVLTGAVVALGVFTAAAAPAVRTPDLPRVVAGLDRPDLMVRPLPDWVVRRALTIPGYRPPASPSARPSAYEALIDDFEGPLLDPFRWIPFDGDGDQYGEYYWAMSRCRAAAGFKSLWAIGGGKDGQRLTCGALYPRGAESHVILVLDLSGWQTPPALLSLTFDTWLNTRSEMSPGGVVGDGLFVRYTHITPEGEERSIVLQNLTSQFPPDWWKDITIDLRNACDVYNPSQCFDLAGRSRVLIEFVFVSTDEPNVQLAEGAYIDNVYLKASEPPVIIHTPTPSPTVEMTPTVSVTETATITATVTVPATTEVPPTMTAEPTAGPVWSELYLPIAAQNHEFWSDGGGLLRTEPRRWPMGRAIQP